MSGCCQDKQKFNSKAKPMIFTQMVKNAFNLDPESAKIKEEDDCCGKENNQTKALPEKSCHENS